jgi:hypothetical protein
MSMIGIDTSSDPHDASGTNASIDNQTRRIMGSRYHAWRRPRSEFRRGVRVGNFARAATAAAKT